MRRRLIIHPSCKKQIATKRKVGQWIYCITCKVKWKEVATRKYEKRHPRFFKAGTA